MATETVRTLDRHAIAKVSRLELRARSAVEGFYSGIHKSPYHGFNVEFAEYREYAPGDDLRYLDWRLFGRSEKFFVKQFEAETNLNAYVLLDCSRSMDFAGTAEPRLDYAAAICAALSLLMLRQGDHVGLVTFDRTVRAFIPPRGHARHFAAILSALETVRPGEDTDIAAVLHEIAERVRRRSLIVLVSDLLDNVERVLRGLQHFRHQRHEVVVFHLLDPAELEFPFERVTLFEGLECQREMVLDPQIVAASYRQRVQEYLEDLQLGCREKSVDYCRMMLDEPFERALSLYLAQRR